MSRRLIARYRGGDLEAFVLLHDRFRRRVFEIARARLWCDDDAEEVTQQVFLKLFRVLAEDRVERASFGAWLCAVARNAAEDYRRKNGRSERAAPDQIDRLVDAAVEGPRGSRPLI